MGGDGRTDGQHINKDGKGKEGWDSGVSACRWRSSVLISEREVRPPSTLPGCVKAALPAASRRRQRRSQPGARQSAGGREGEDVCEDGISTGVNREQGRGLSSKLPNMCLRGLARPTPPWDRSSPPWLESSTRSRSCHQHPPLTCDQCPGGLGKLGRGGLTHSGSWILGEKLRVIKTTRRQAGTVPSWGTKVSPQKQKTVEMESDVCQIRR